MKKNTSNNFDSRQSLKTAVLFLVFNRLDTTKRVFESIRQARPPRLYVAADGPRDSRPGEVEKVNAVRNHILNYIDWNCEVKTLFREKNLGCKYAVSSAIDWFYANEEMGIILEDDCLPHPTFFMFCEELLYRYRNDDRIGIISGDNFQFGKSRNEHSYYFTRYTHIWGWASWHRTWEKYDVGIKQWPKLKKDGWLFDIFTEKQLVRYWENVFDNIFNNRIDTWDHQLTFAILTHSMLNIMPNKNLISNIGFDDDATHTTKKNHFSNIHNEEMTFPLIHPEFIIRNIRSDRITEKKHFLPHPIMGPIIDKIKAVLS